jgi:4-hydroxybenzoate polyprenyltransferase
MFQTVLRPPTNLMASARRGSGTLNRAIKVASGYLLLPQPGPLLIVLAATAGFVVIASGGNVSDRALIRILLAMLGAQLVIGTVNELADEELDRRTKSRKPIPAGLVSRRGASVVGAIGVLLMVAFSVSFGALSLLICAAGTAIGVTYSLWFKRTRFAWLPYLLALPLLPIWVWTALDHNVTRLLLLYPLGAPAIVSIYLSQSLPDIAGDREGDVRNLPVLLGERRTLLISWGAMLLTTALVRLASSSITVRSGALELTSILAIGFVAVDAVLYMYNPRYGIAACFTCMAVAGAGLGLGWVVAVAS